MPIRIVLLVSTDCYCYCYWGCYFDVEYGTVVHAVTDRTVVQVVAGVPVAGKSAIHAFAGGIVVYAVPGGSGRSVYSSC
jgi:hypothetical protein